LAAVYKIQEASKPHNMTWYKYNDQEKPKPQQSQSCPVGGVVWYVW